ncbi:hypothetical protein RclHR1_13630001 [Rhizophagus clarus]|uniref:Uncharacterized protein n=1 Tax=Rhizophagus clarus TaxID=94130 RepID=A0A2Z6QR36_9GLOM|nr:hypothetical protein RclHR1_13630001 [Rhizophagus clarus]
MFNVHTLKNIEDRGAVGGLLGKQIPPGQQLGSIRELEFEKALCGSIKTASDIANDYKDLQDVCLKQKKDLVLVQANANKKISQLNATNTRLRSSEQLSRKATLAQKASSLDKIKILSLEVKISELEGKLENLELEQVFYDLNINGGILEELGKQEDLKLPDWIDESLKSFVYVLGLENKVKKIEKKIAKEDLLEVLQKALLERNSLIQEAKRKESTNACLAEQIQKTSSEYEVHGGTRSCLSASDQNEPLSVSKPEKDNDITSPELIRPQRDFSILPITAGHKVT